MIRNNTKGQDCDDCCPCCCCCKPSALNKRDFKPDDDCDWIIPRCDCGEVIEEDSSESSAYVLLAVVNDDCC